MKKIIELLLFSLILFCCTNKSTSQSNNGEINKVEQAPTILNPNNPSNGKEEIEFLRNNKNIQNFTLSKEIGSGSIDKYVFQFRSIDSENQKGIKLYLLTMDSECPISTVKKEEHIKTISKEIIPVIEKLFPNRTLSSQLSEKLKKLEVDNYSDTVHDFNVNLDLNEYDEVLVCFKTIDFWTYSTSILIHSAK